MKRNVFLLLVVALVAAGAYFLLTNKKDKPAENRPDPIAVSEKTGAFDQSFGLMLNRYFEVKDALVASDTVKANEATRALLAASDSLRVEDIKGDSTGTIRSLVKDLSGTVTSSCQALLAEPKLDSKRKEFQMISTALWDLMRTSRYGGLKVYKLYCPMAFDNAGAEWLSNESEIRNPYMGQQMLTCGSVEDSLDYSTK